MLGPGLERPLALAAGTDTISVGAISVVASRDVDPNTALASVDLLLYEAKAAGRDRCVHVDLITQTKTMVSRALSPL